MTDRQPEPATGASQRPEDPAPLRDALAALRATEDRFRFVRESTGIGFWYCDLPFDVLQWDEQVRRHFHVPPDEVVTLDTFYARMHPDDREPTRQAIAHSIEDHASYDVDYRTVDPSTGAVTWIRAIGRTAYGADDRPISFDGVTVDVTERKLAEVALRESELRYRLVGQAANDTIWDWDLAKNEVRWNEGIERVFGYAAADVGASGQWWLEHLHPEDRDRVDEVLHDAIASAAEVWSDEYRFRRADGSYATVFDRGRIVRDAQGAPLRMVGSMLDLTERKRVEAVLRDSEQRYRTLVEQVTDYAIFRTDVRGRATTWNEGVGRVLGVAEREFLGRDTAAVTGEDAESLAAATAGGSARVERWMTRPDGTRFYALDVTTPLRDEAGRLVGFSKVLRDQTDQKRLEDELREVAARLADASGRKDEFLATLAHELRNPLAPLRTSLQILKLAPDAAVAERARSVMERQLDQMVRLVDDLMDVSRITRGKLELRTARVDLAAVLAAAVETSRPLVAQMGHHLEVALPVPALFVTADLTRLAQVFSNLLNNAAKYSERGGRIRLSATPDGGEVVVTVRDEGIGIPVSELETIFDPFSQVDRSIERAQGGLGIGLTLVKRLVEMHGGSVVARSAGPGHGSEFVVRLPAAGAADDRPAGEAAPTPARRLRILVVDDNVDGAEMLGTFMTMLGHEPIVSHDGAEALELAERRRPDVALLDIGLPGLDGYEVCRAIRGRPWGHALFLVAVTGWGQPTDRQRTAEAGFDHHLVKPVDPTALGRLLAERFRTR